MWDVPKTMCEHGKSFLCVAQNWNVIVLPPRFNTHRWCKICLTWPEGHVSAAIELYENTLFRFENQTFIADLEGGQRRQLLILTINNGRGSRDFARRSLADDKNGDPKPDPINNAVPRWCICGNYIQMPTSEKINVAREGCASPHMNCSVIFVLTDIFLGLAIRARRDARVESLDFSMAPVSEKLPTGSLFYGNMGI